MNRAKKSLRISSFIVAICVWLPLSACAVGLSGIKVLSALGQPLSAEVEVTAMQAEEFARILARIASPEDYQAARLVYLPLLRQVRVTGERRADGRLFLNMTTVSPINEPTLDLLVDFNWRGGRLLQKYSVLLDPPK
ncbi:MAG: hypothetical protein LH481_14785 [Burkholderiales bacterium]|nr:hypothetical protein [Burkholderiales bacterium]